MLVEMAVAIAAALTLAMSVAMSTATAIATLHDFMYGWVLVLYGLIVLWEGGWRVDGI